MSYSRRVSLFGVAVLEIDGRREAVAQKALALLAYLAHQREPVPRRLLAALLWGETSDYRSRRNLTHTLGQLTSSLPGCFQADQQAVMWHPQAPAWVDVRACANLLVAHDPLRAQPLDQGAQAGLLEQAVALYRGDLLAGLTLDDCPEFELWLARERERWRQHILAALAALGAHHAHHAHAEPAEGYLRRWVELEPWQEEAHRALMRLLASRGRPAEALAQYERCRRTLSDELGLAPSAETVALAEQIRGGRLRQSHAPPALPPDSPGQQLVPLPARPPVLSALPSPPPLIARDAELATLNAWRAAPDCRVALVTGIGGVGKSTLAAALAAQVAARGEAVAWCSLLNAPPVDEVARQCLHALGADPALPQQAQVGELAAALAERLRDRHGLIVLDNAESVLDAARGSGGYRPGCEDYQLLFATLVAAPHQGLVLITSRALPPDLARRAGPAAPVRILRLAGLPDEAAASLQELWGLRGAPEARIALAQRYSGIPLALQLTAALIQDLFDGEIGAFLQAEAPILGGVRGLLDEQVDRLASLERQALLWLAVERLPADPRALAERLAHLGPKGAILEALHGLVRRSLVERQGGRLALHSVVMEYATERLIAACCADLEQGRLDHLQSHPLLLARAPAYLRQAQVRMLLQPVSDQLLARLGTGGLEAALRGALAALRALPAHTPGYAAANLLHLLLQAGFDLCGVDLAGRCVWQADLRRAALPAVSFAGADLSGTAFADTFDRPLSLAYSPDGSLVAAGTVEGQIRLWHTSSWQPDRVLASGNAFVSALAFSPDGATLASNGPNNTLWLWDVASGQPRLRLEGHTGLIYAAAYAPDGCRLASTSHDGTLRLWDSATGEELSRLAGHEAPVWHVAFSPDGRAIASASLDQTVGLWDVATGALVQRLCAHEDKVNAVAFAPDGSTLASAGADQTIILWDPHTGEARSRLEGHTSVVHTLAFSPDGRLLASASDDRSVRLWEHARGRQAALLAGHRDFVRAVAFSPDGRTLVSGGGDQTVRLWDVAEARLLETLYGQTAMLLAVAATGSDGGLSCGGVDGIIAGWGGDGRARRPLAGHQSWLRALAATPDGRTLASGGDDRAIRLWDVERGVVRTALNGHEDGVYGLAFSPDGRLLASASQDLTVRLWDVAAGQLRHTLRRHAIRARAVAFSPDGATLASCGADGLVARWDVASGRHLGDLIGHAGWVSSVAYCPRSGVLISAGMDQLVRIWEPGAGAPRELRGHSSAVNRVLVTADGATIISAGFDRTIRLWDRESGAPRGELHGHQVAVADLALTVEDVLLSVDIAGTACRWDLGQRTCLATLQIAGRYAGMRIDGAVGLSPAQRASLLRLGALEWAEPARDESPLVARTLGVG